MAAREFLAGQQRHIQHDIAKTHAKSRQTAKLLNKYKVTDENENKRCTEVVMRVCRRVLSMAMGYMEQPQVPAAEVLALLMEMKMTPRHMHRFHRTFLYLKNFDALDAQIAHDEVGASSLLRLVRTEADWVAKILYLLLESSGSSKKVTWNCFLYVTIQFCRCSKMELCQILFYLISIGMKNWSVHYLTSTQLDEFFEDWHECPNPLFNTKNIVFSQLPLAKYQMIDFVQLLHRYPPLLNPILHLQKCIQKWLPSSSFWRDYDKVKVLNRNISFDYLRFQKVIALSDVFFHRLRGKDRQARATMTELACEDPIKAAAAALSRDTLAGNIPVPLGPLPPPRQKLGLPKQYPPWLQEILKSNEDPKHRLPLGTAKEIQKQVRWAELPHIPGPDDPRSVDEAKKIFKSLMSDRLKEQYNTEAKINQEDKLLQTMGERQRTLTRSKELEFIQKAREIGATVEENLVTLMHRTFLGELITRPLSGL